jgi:hydroxyacyl-ACP dehydratase HTD2-like protein with hotdog domain
VATQPLEMQSIEVGEALPERIHQPDIAELFLYNAVLFNAHRIHFDERYAREVEGYPGLVVAGPQQGEWLAERVIEWMGDAGSLVGFSYQNRRAAYLGERLCAGGRVTAVDRERAEVELELEIRNDAGEVVTPGRARVRFR